MVQVMSEGEKKQEKREKAEAMTKMGEGYQGFVLNGDSGRLTGHPEQDMLIKDGSIDAL